MELDATGPLLWVLYLMYGVLGLALVMTFVRLLIGPTLADRVVALDLVSYQAIAFMIIYAVVERQQQFIEVALVLALIAFLGTVAFARYVEYQSRPDAKSNEQQEVS